MLLSIARPIWARSNGASRGRSAGNSIVELMVAITAGLIILAGLVTLFADNSRARAEIDRANQQIENGRYALSLLQDELHNAGYLAEFNPAVLATPGAYPDPCDTSVAGLNAAAPIAVQGFDQGAGAPGCLSDLRPGTDILVVRRASNCAVGDPGCDGYLTGHAYLQASACDNPSELASGNVATYYVLDTNTANLSLHQKDCATAAGWHQYHVNIYFIANDDKAADGIPTLKRAELGAGAFNIVPLVEGVENMQIEYGLDTSVPTTGAPAIYTADPNTYNSCIPSVCLSYWRNTVAATLYLLTRSTSTTQGYTDTKIYYMGLNADGSENTVGPFADGYRRHLFVSSVRLNNPSGRNTQ